MGRRCSNSSDLFWYYLSSHLMTRRLLLRFHPLVDLSQRIQLNVKHKHCGLPPPANGWLWTTLTLILRGGCAFAGRLLPSSSSSSSSVAAPPCVQPCSSRWSCSTKPSSCRSFFLRSSAATRSRSAFSSSSSRFASRTSAASDSTGILEGDDCRETDVWFNLFLLPLRVCIYNTAITVTRQPR